MAYKVTPKNGEVQEKEVLDLSKHYFKTPKIGDCVFCEHLVATYKPETFHAFVKEVEEDFFWILCDKDNQVRKIPLDTWFLEKKRVLGLGESDFLFVYPDESSYERESEEDKLAELLESIDFDNYPLETLREALEVFLRATSLLDNRY